MHHLKLIPTLALILALGVLAGCGSGGGGGSSGSGSSGGSDTEFRSASVVALSSSDEARQKVEAAFRSQDPNQAIAAMREWATALRADAAKVKSLNAPEKCRDEQAALSEFALYRAGFYDQLATAAESSSDPGAILSQGSRSAELQQRTAQVQPVIQRLDSDNPCG